MSTSSFFHNLHRTYQAELEDLRTDSEGQDVLQKRLRDKRKALGFLVKMIEVSPEMVAVVLHQAFRFKSPAAMEHLQSQDADVLPAWDSISETIEISPWAHDIVQTLLKEPKGEWFLTLAATLEYMHSKPMSFDERAGADDSDENDDDDGTHDRDAARNARHDDNHTEDHDEEEAQARAREEAGNDWMVAQGFDRKD